MILGTLDILPSTLEVLPSTLDQKGDSAVGAVLEQLIDHQWRPIAFFSRKLKPAQIRYRAFDRELLGVYLTIRHFRWFLEGRPFHVYTDHKPLTFAISSASAQLSPRQIRQLAGSSLSSPRTCAMWRERETPSPTPSRVFNSTQLRARQSTSLPWLKLKWVTQRHNIWKPVAPACSFLIFHSKVMTPWRSCAMFPRVIRTCIPCQQSKIHRHTTSPTTVRASRSPFRRCPRGPCSPFAPFPGFAIPAHLYRPLHPLEGSYSADQHYSRSPRTSLDGRVDRTVRTAKQYHLRPRPTVRIHPLELSRASFGH